MTRKLYKFSQEKLASLVGCSLSTIKSVERGKLRPSADLTHRIYMQTGLDPAQLLGNFSPDKPRDPCGVLLTKEMLALRKASGRLPDQQTRPDEQDREQVDGSLALYGVVLETLLDASVRPRKLWALRPALQKAIDKLINDFDLGKDFRHILFDRYGVRNPWSADMHIRVNGPLRGKQRAAADAKRNEFYGAIQLHRDTDQNAA